MRKRDWMEKRKVKGVLLVEHSTRGEGGSSTGEGGLEKKEGNPEPRQKLGRKQAGVRASASFTHLQGRKKG